MRSTALRTTLFRKESFDLTVKTARAKDKNEGNLELAITHGCMHVPSTANLGSIAIRVGYHLTTNELC